MELTTRNLVQVSQKYAIDTVFIALLNFSHASSSIDEADIIKSDGDHVFVGYGHLVVAWDAVSGQELSRTKLPERKTLTTDEGTRTKDL